jgi:geranylgeranyl diphosphate synthase type I
LKLISDDQLRSVDRRVLDHAKRLLAGKGVDALSGPVLDYLLDGGKRIRPQLVLWTYGLASDATTGLDPRTPDRGSALSFVEADPCNPALDVAAAWELFHAFLLIHDDIIDASDRRRDRPALHVSLMPSDAVDASIARSTGLNLAIVAGDLLYGASHSILHDLEIDAERLRPILKLFSRVSMMTGLGQATDILLGQADFDAIDEQTLLREYVWKTAAYTFEGPMLSGAILARLDDRACDAVSRFALAIGQAYQLQNDLLDLAAECHEGSDLVQGKRTVTLVRHRLRLDAIERSEFDRRLAEIATANGHAVQLAEMMRAELLQQGAMDPTRRLIDDLLESASRAASDEVLPARLRAGLSGLLSTLRGTYFAAVDSVLASNAHSA